LLKRCYVSLQQELGDFIIRRQQLNSAWTLTRKLNLRTQHTGVSAPSNVSVNVVAVVCADALSASAAAAPGLSINRGAGGEMRPIVVANCIFIYSSPAFSSVIFRAKSPIARLRHDKWLFAGLQSGDRSRWIRMCVCFWPLSCVKRADCAAIRVAPRNYCLFLPFTYSASGRRDGPSGPDALCCYCAAAAGSDRCSSCQKPPKAMRRSRSVC
jgi:hypothetical protein